jgi:hypothetical protein
MCVPGCAGQGGRCRGGSNDMTVLMALRTIASEQTKGTERTLEKAYQVLDYLATHPNAVVRF